jgi:hypothetical protein
MSKQCLTLVCPLGTEEALLDALLEESASEVFTSVPVYSHSAAHTSLSAQEQVMGRSRSLQLQVLVDEGNLVALLERIRADFSGVGIRFWATPVAIDGEIK